MKIKDLLKLQGVSLGKSDLTPSIRIPDFEVQFRSNAPFFYPLIKIIAKKFQLKLYIYYRNSQNLGILYTLQTRRFITSGFFFFKKFDFKFLKC